MHLLFLSASEELSAVSTTGELQYLSRDRLGVDFGRRREHKPQFSLMRVVMSTAQVHTKFARHI